MFDVISIGDCVIDTFIPLLDAEIVNNKENIPSIALRFGDKLPVGPSISLVAGNAANNAVGISRLNLKTAIYTHVGNLGDDADDDRIKKKFKKESVDIRYVIETNKYPSNHHIVLTFKGDRTILIYHQPWEYNLPDLDRTKWVYFTSLGPTFPQTKIVEQLIRYLERTGAKLLYNPGTFQIKHGVKKSPRLLSLSEIFIVNVEESKRILGIDETKEVPIKKLLNDLVDLGPRKVIITDADKGSYGFDGEKYFKLGIFKTKLVETTGAGDAYATGVLAGLYHGEDLAGAMRWGAAEASSVIEQIGPQAGLLTYNQMQERLKENKNIVAKEI